MSEAPITATVDISDAVSPRLRAAVAKLSDRTGLHKAMAFRVEDRVIENLQAKDQTPNKLGGSRTHFWLNASRTTVVTADDAAGQISIPGNGGGVRLHYLGGTVVAGANGSGKKWLTIPARAESHGKTVSKFFDGDFGKGKWLFNRNRNPYAIADRATGVVYFWLTKSATIKKDPSVLPSTEIMRSAAASAAADYINAEVAA